MNLGTYDITIDFSKLFIHNNTSIYFKEGDLNTAKVKARLSMKNKPIDIFGCNVTIRIETSEGEVITDNATIIDPYSGVIEIDFKSNALIEGTHLFEVWIIKEDSIKKSGKIGYRVLDSIEDAESIEGTNEYPILISLISDTNKAIQSATEALNRANEMQTDIEEAINNTNVAISNAEKATSDANSKINEVNNSKDEMINNVNTSISNMKEEVDAAKADMQASADETIDDINRALAAGTVDLELKKARDGEIDLDTRLKRDLAKGKIHYETVEGSYINATDTLDSFLENIEIKGNTVQNPSNLSDIKSVGDKVEGQELFEIPILCKGKNLFSGKLELGNYGDSGQGLPSDSTTTIRTVNKIKVVPNTSCTLSNDKGYPFAVRYYGNDDTIVYNESLGGSNGVRQIEIPADCCAINVVMNGIDLTTKLQLEEGTVATEYEPYQSHELTILSPCQIEKVRDIEDRIIEKDGVWGVEKNIDTVVFNGSEKPTGSYYDSNYFALYYKNNTDLADINQFADCVISSSKYLNHTSWADSAFQKGNVAIFNTTNSKGEFQLTFKRDLGQFNSVDDCINYIKNNNFYFKAKLKTPQFIPIPHDQQVKLRTFANRTNILFLCEVEGTIKADVPKSIGASVNSNTKAIQDINKDLERVKKLEEATTTTVTTESNFVAIEQTSNGYLSDIKLEGRTLVSQQSAIVNEFFNGTTGEVATNPNTRSVIADVEVGEKYTIIKSKPSTRFYIGCGESLNVGDTLETLFGQQDNDNCIAVVTTTKPKLMAYVSNIGEDISALILKGDHTQNPPPFFEGMKSVGDETDEIVVISNSGNLVDYKDYNFINEIKLDNDTIIINSPSDIKYVRKNIQVPPNVTMYVKANVTGSKISLRGSNNKNAIYHEDLFYLTPTRQKQKFVTPYDGNLNIGYFVDRGGNGTIKDVMLSFNDINYIPFKQDKKQLLSLDTDGTWKKPILREWDSIEKHSDGKYRNHNRSGKVTFDGTETGWQLASVVNGTCRFFILPSSFSPIKKSGGIFGLICDTLPVTKNEADSSRGVAEYSQVVNGDGRIYIKLYTDELISPDVTGLLDWLKKHPTTIVYQLAEEKIYECTPIDLQSFDPQTNYMIECEPISPRTTIKCNNYIGNVINTLKEKVSYLEDKLYKTNLANFTVALNTLETKLRLDRLEAPTK